MLVFWLLICQQLMQNVESTDSGCVPTTGVTIPDQNTAAQLSLFSYTGSFSFVKPQTYACYINYYGKGTDSLFYKTTCTATFFYTCCPNTGYSNTDPSCAGSQVTRKILPNYNSNVLNNNAQCGTLYSNNVACKLCTNALPSNAQWSSYCSWNCIRGFIRSSDSKSCTCPAGSYIDNSRRDTPFCKSCSLPANGIEIGRAHV